MIFRAKRERRTKSSEAALDGPVRTFCESDEVAAEKAIFYSKLDLSGDR